MDTLFTILGMRGGIGGAAGAGAAAAAADGGAVAELEALDEEAVDCCLLEAFSSGALEPVLEGFVLASESCVC